MLTDVIIVALTVALGVWGYSRGVSVGILVAVGFGIGALLGSRIGPQLLDGGLRDPLAPALALPGALLLGGALAAASERFGFELSRRLRRRYTVDAIGGALLAGFLAVVLVWVIAAAGAQVDGLKETVRESEVISQLNSVLPPPGPLLAASRSYSLPVLDGPGARLRAPSDEVKRDPEVEAAARSVVKIDISKCVGRGSGSGWIAADGIVVTNAHVVRPSQSLGVRIEGEGKAHDATPISYDVKNDVSVLRVPGVKGLPRLRITGTPKVDSSAAVLGFPFDKRYKVRAARVGPTRIQPNAERLGRVFVDRVVTPMLADVGVGAGSSGGPVVDLKGRVVAMIFASPFNRGRLQWGVPSVLIKRDLERAIASPRTVDTGDCDDG